MAICVTLGGLTAAVSIIFLILISGLGALAIATWVLKLVKQSKKEKSEQQDKLKD